LAWCGGRGGSLGVLRRRDEVRVMDFLLAALVRWWRRRAKFESFSFF